jgi:hypothetical protein
MTDQSNLPQSVCLFSENSPKKRYDESIVLKCSKPAGRYITRKNIFPMVTNTAIPF